MSGKNEWDEFKKILKIFAYLLLFMLLWGAVLFIAIKVVDTYGSEELQLWVLLSLSGAVFISFLPFFNYAIKRTFYYSGTGTPLSPGSLKNKLKEINNFSAPVMVEDKGKKLVITWRYVDAKWWEIFAKAGLEKIYELHVRFLEQKNEVILTDVMKDVSWKVGPETIKLSAGFFRGINVEVAIGKQWGIKENFSIGKIYDYKFIPAEIKNPVINEILRSGWSVRFAMW